MNLSQCILTSILLLTACNQSRSGSSELLNETQSPDSSCLVEGEILPVDTLAKVKEEQLDSLISAARNNNISLVKSLIHRGADANGKIFRSRYFWESPLSEAARRNHPEVAMLLVEAGADPNLELGENLTAFHRSAGGCSGDVGRCSDILFNLLLAKGGDVNTFNKYNGRTPLLTAISSGDLKKVTILLEHGAVIDPDSINAFQSPLALAASQLQFEIMVLLLKRGANINATTSELVEDCMLCPVNITILHSIVSMSNYLEQPKAQRLLEIALKQKPDLNIESADGYTPLDFAAYGTNTALIDTLVKHGAKLETKGRSALHCAAQFSNLPMVMHLLKYGVNVNIQDTFGNTPLHLCLTCCGNGFGEGITETSRAETIELLLNHGADPTLKNDRGESFLQECKKGTYKKVTQVLLKRGLLTKGDIRTQ